MDTDTAKTAVIDWRARSAPSEDEARRQEFIFVFIIWRKAGGVAASPLVLRATGSTVLPQLPFKVLSGHLVEHHVKGFVELVQPANHVRVDFGVSSPFGLAEAPGRAAVLGLLQTRESFCLIEVEVFVRDDPLEPQEVLHFAHFARRIHDEPLPADKVHLGEREVLHPALQVERVDPDAQRAPRGVDEAQRPVLESQNLEGGDLGLLG